MEQLVRWFQCKRRVSLTWNEKIKMIVLRYGYDLNYQRPR